MEEQDQVVARRKKLAELEARGHRRFPNDFRPRDTAAELAAANAAATGADLDAHPVPATVAGRIMAVRNFGKAAFAQLQDRSGRIQIYVRRDEVGERDFDVFRFLDLGDFSGFAGRLFRTKTGELSVLAARVHYLAKALRPLPEKWHGLQDVELRYRQRYLDLLNPDVQRIFRVRAQVLQGVREFFGARGFLEVETPMMQQIAGGALARPFITHHNALDLDLYLRVAPELFLKRLLVGGLERVFELNRNFRNEGISTEHNPEFTMLEFYQAYATWEDLLTITEELVTGLARAVIGDVRFPYGPHQLDLTPPWRRLAVKDAVVEATSLARADVDDIGCLRAVAAERDIPLPADTPYGKVLAEVFEKTAEATLVQPTFVVDYPVEISPLARQSDRDPTLVDRFELFIAGREIANGFSELNDPDEQRARFEEQLRARRGGDEEAHAMDEDYVRALEHGMPPAAGEGIGIDRLVMLLTDAPSIRDVILFPQLRPERR
ncbi:MAG: lysine--tRNA ligase [Deltaproteobacteria bacterium]|nr:lysine--tRNA ligase [Deltaproteobacteria bacterium]